MRRETVCNRTFLKNRERIERFVIMACVQTGGAVPETKRAVMRGKTQKTAKMGEGFLRPADEAHLWRVHPKMR